MREPERDLGRLLDIIQAVDRLQRRARRHPVERHNQDEACSRAWVCNDTAGITVADCIGRCSNAEGTD